MFTSRTSRWGKKHSVTMMEICWFSRNRAAWIFRLSMEGELLYILLSSMTGLSSSFQNDGSTGRVGGCPRRYQIQSRIARWTFSRMWVDTILNARYILTFALDVQEIFGSHYELPELGPVGSNGMALPRDFEFPVASFDIDSLPWEGGSTFT